MEERKGLYRSLGRIAWGYALIYLNININALDLLPEWAGWLLIGSALPGVAGAGEPSALLLRPPCWPARGLGGPLPGLLDGHGESPRSSGVCGSSPRRCRCYVHFQLFTNLAGAAERFACPQRRSLLVLRTVNVVSYNDCSCTCHCPWTPAMPGWSGHFVVRVPRYHRLARWW